MPSLHSQHVRGTWGGAKSNSLVRMTNWYWPTMATVIRHLSVGTHPKSVLLQHAIHLSGMVC